MEIKKVGVVGCGRVPSGRGAGSAQICAQSGYRTVVRETEWAEHGLARIEAILLTAAAQPSALNNLHATTADLAAVISPAHTIFTSWAHKRSREQWLDLPRIKDLL